MPPPRPSPWTSIPAEAVRRQDATPRIVRGIAGAVVRARADAQGSSPPASTGAVLAAATLGVGRSQGRRADAALCQLPCRAPPAPRPPAPTSAPTPTARRSQSHSSSSPRWAPPTPTIVLGVENPTVGLLNNGTEETKGSEAALGAPCGSRGHQGHATFSGNCEGRDILTGDLDVIVSDGFTGNIALKAVEGTAKFIVSALKAAAGESKKVALGALLVKPAMKEVAALRPATATAEPPCSASRHPCSWATEPPIRTPS